MISINLFSIADLLAVIVIGPIGVIFVVRSLWITRAKTDFLFSGIVLAGLVWAALAFVMDNVVPTDQPANEVPDAAARTLLLARLSYAVGTIVMALTVHFTLLYTKASEPALKRIHFLYALAIGFWPVIFFCDAFIRAPDAPLGLASHWLLAVPWMPVPGPLTLLFAVAWMASMGYVQYLIWVRPRKSSSNSLTAARGITVRAGLTAFAVSGLIDIASGLAGYAGISIASMTAWIGMVVVAVGLAREWRSTELERAHVRRRFESYVDPSLVEYVIEHPEQARFDGEVRELTVAFTDLEGYTPLAEKLRGQAVPLLNEYFSLLTPLIRECNGYRSKFLGDGIMFFYGAPEWNCDHAMQAVSTVLKMQETLIGFNEKLFERGMPALLTRIGVSSGEMIVGDAGSDDASDYTVFGDLVNLGARLESANKQTGTRILISEGTKKLLPADLFLIRPIGKLQVVGISRAVMTYEPMSYLDQATETQRKFAELTQRLVESFLDGDFTACLTAERHLVEVFGPSKLAALYRERCEFYRANPPGPDFTGEIVLESK